MQKAKNSIYAYLLDFTEIYSKILLYHCLIYFVTLANERKETAQMLNISVNYLAKLRSEKYNKDKDGNRSKFFIPYL